MLKILTLLIETLIKEISQKLAGKAFEEKPKLCKDLMRLYIATEDLLQKATTTYNSFETLTERHSQTEADNNLRQQARQDARELVETLKKFETNLKSVFTALKLIGGQELSIRLAKVPEASYLLFKKYFVDDLCPKYVADTQGKKYVLRIARQNKNHELVSTDAMGSLSLDLEMLFEEGSIGYELVDFNDKKQVALILQDCTQDLIRLNGLVEILGESIRKTCDLSSVL